MTLHRRDLVSLFFGLVFALCGLAFLNRSENWDVFASGGLLAIGLIAIGALGIVLVLTGSRGERSSQPDPFDPDATTDLDAAADLDATTGLMADDFDSVDPDSVDPGSYGLDSHDRDLDLPGFDDPYGPDGPPT